MGKTFFLAFLLATVILTSCKGGSTARSLTGIEVSSPRNYTQAELLLGRRICSALKEKRVFFENLKNMEEKFRFRGELKNCETEKPFEQVDFIASISNVSSVNLEYVANNRTNYFKDVITEQSGILKTLCDNLNVSDSVANTFSMENFSLVVNLLLVNKFDTVQITKQSKRGNGELKIVSSESISLITNSKQADKKFIGVEKERILNTFCSIDSTKFSYTKQNWQGAVTQF